MRVIVRMWSQCIYFAERWAGLENNSTSKSVHRGYVGRRNILNWIWKSNWPEVCGHCIGNISLMRLVKLSTGFSDLECPWNGKVVGNYPYALLVFVSSHLDFLHTPVQACMPSESIVTWSPHPPQQSKPQFLTNTCSKPQLLANTCSKPQLVTNTCSKPQVLTNVPMSIVPSCSKPQPHLLKNAAVSTLCPVAGITTQRRREAKSSVVLVPLALCNVLHLPTYTIWRRHGDGQILWWKQAPL